MEALHDPDAADPGSGPVVTRCRAALQRIADLNPRLGALTDVLPATALQEAANADARAALGVQAGPVDGWLLVVKDNIDTVPARCSAGLAFQHERRPNTDAPVVARLREAGAVILGVGFTDSGAFGVTSRRVEHPTHPDRTVGGSSGGSGAAVAAGLCDAALGTDTGGSVRIPAACGGIAAFKPTRGRVPIDGIRPLSVSIDHVGVLAGSVAALQAVGQAIDAGFDGLAPAFDGPLTVGIPVSYFADADDEVLASLNQVVGVLRAEGATLREVDIGTPDAILAAHGILALTEAARDCEAADGPDLSRYPPITAEGILFGRSCTAADNVLAARHRDQFVARLAAVMAQADLLLLPTLPIAPPARLADAVLLNGEEVPVLNALIRYTAAFNQSGHPVVALPVPCLDPADDALPGSVQLVGRWNDDRRLLHFAQSVEAALRSRRG